MFVHPEFDPIALQLGPLAVRWYGLMYLCGFLAFWVLGRHRAARSDSFIQPQQVGDFLFYAVLGVIAGGRLGSVLFYNFDYFLQQPLYLFEIWKGGMSFHGGLLGVIVAIAVYQHKKGWGFLRLADFIAPLVPLGLGFGRIGNFINAELWGRVTDLPWAVIFPQVDGLGRHPSQLYQAALEGLLLFIVLWLYSSRPRPTGAVAAVFLFLYGGFRFLVEIVREPDQHLGFVAYDFLTMGQLLSLPMIICGAFLFWCAQRGMFSRG
ncbi:MAG: prolipoprotein diacylglyceryl transferase [Candidatus Thioglobus sp.]|nr:MAG: prolipoprotein diacylglyceryl transferase [Candidatus Thioglobus sp.]|tara:strand:+ start:428 stop:1219 length:792 start_codon:yes stop_codon:yes gene_type:complete